MSRRPGTIRLGEALAGVAALALLLVSFLDW